MTESVAEKIDSESKKNEISDYSFGAYNILENTQSKANVWFRKTYRGLQNVPILIRIIQM